MAQQQALDVRLAAMSLTWNNPSGEAFVPWLAEVKTLGYDGIAGFAERSLAPFVGDPGALRRLLADHGLALASVDIPLDLQFDRYRRICDFMAEVSAPHLVCIGGQGDADADCDAIAAVLNRIGEIAAERGVLTGYHNRAPGTGGLYGDFTRVLARIDPDKVVIMLDVGHATRDFKDLPDVPTRAAHFLERYGDRLRFLEMKDWHPETNLNTPLGEGRCDFGRVFALLRKAAYRGWITIEQNGCDGRSRGRAPGECARASLAFARRHLDGEIDSESRRKAAVAKSA